MLIGENATSSQLECLQTDLQLLDLQGKKAFAAKHTVQNTARISSFLGSVLAATHQVKQITCLVVMLPRRHQVVILGSRRTLAEIQTALTGHIAGPQQHPAALAAHAHPGSWWPRMNFPT